MSIRKNCICDKGRVWVPTNEDDPDNIDGGNWVDCTQPGCVSGQIYLEVIDDEEPDWIDDYVDNNHYDLDQFSQEDYDDMY